MFLRKKSAVGSWQSVVKGLAFLLVAAFCFLPPAYSQEIIDSVPIHPRYNYDPKLTMWSWQQDKAATGHEVDFLDKNGVAKCWADADGQLNCTGQFGAETIQKNGAFVGTQPIVNFIEGTNITITATNDVGNNRVNLTFTSTATTTRNCTIVAGSNNGAILVNADIAPQSWQCKVPKAATVIEIDVHADAGTSSVTVDRNYNGAQASLLSAPLATTGSGGEACANVAGGLGLDGITTCSATLQNVSAPAGSYFETLTGSASGTAHIFSVSIVFTMVN